MKPSSCEFGSDCRQSPFKENWRVFKFIVNKSFIKTKTDFSIFNAFQIHASKNNSNERFHFWWAAIICVTQTVELFSVGKNSLNSFFEFREYGEDDRLLQENQPKRDEWQLWFDFYSKCITVMTSRTNCRITFVFAVTFAIGCCIFRTSVRNGREF